MDWGTIMMMRHELLLVAVAVILLIVELNLTSETQGRVVSWALGLFAAHTLIGFFPVETGELFGGMYRSTGLTTLMKNILNIGVLIVFIQSAAWLKGNDDNHNRISEYFILMISTLIGMNYMISSGDFLIPSRVPLHVITRVFPAVG